MTRLIDWQKQNELFRQVLGECFFLCLQALAVKGFAQDTRVMTALVSAIVLARFVVMGQKHDWVFFLLGVVAGGGNDMISMIKEVYRYTPDHFLKEQFDIPLPPWMLLFWGHVFTGFRHLFHLGVFQGPPLGRRPWRLDKRLALDAATVAALRWVIYHTVRQEPLPTIGYALVLSARFLALPPTAAELRLMAVTTVLGILFEASLIGSGLYVYDDPVLLGMPAWLLIYWTFAIPVLAKGIFDRTEAGLARRWVFG